MADSWPSGPRQRISLQWKLREKMQLWTRGSNQGRNSGFRSGCWCWWRSFHRFRRGTTGEPRRSKTSSTGQQHGLRGLWRLQKLIQRLTAWRRPCMQRKERQARAEEIPLLVLHHMSCTR